MSYRVGVDIGGTFIDFCTFDEATGALHSLKVLTTPEEPGRELMQGIARLQQLHGLDPAEIAHFVHGTTVGINTILQRKGARLALFTTLGFEDVVELARLRLPDMYSLFAARPRLLVPRHLVFGIGGRVLADGTEQAPLDEAALAEAAAAARARGAEGIVIAFLNAYANPAHEQQAADIVARLAPELFVFRSAEVWPVIREYERSMTAILNAYVHPRVSAYLGALQAALRRQGVPARPMLARSNGGIMDAELGKRGCVQMLLSGTASGVIGAAHVAALSGVGDVLTLDIGGTSADVALVIGGRPQYGTGERIGEYPLHVPSVSVTSIGSGGGSIARVDGFGVLKVGPESAGSSPGPACYGGGGDRPTITDAMVVCGFLGHAKLAYGSVPVDRARAEAALAPLARALGLGLRETAESVLRVAIAGMFAEVTKLVARYGVDLRDFTLLPFGGAGPMLGCFLARELGLKRVLIPRRPGVVSALGGLLADVRSDFIRTVLLDAAPDAAPRLRDAFGRLRAEAEHWLRREQGFTGPAAIALSADMRYHGQSFEIEVGLEPGWIEAEDMEAVATAFHAQHRRIYDFSDEAAPVQIMNLRLVISGATPKPDFGTLPAAEAAAVPERHVDAWYEGALHDVPVYRRDALLRGHCLSGPAIVIQPDTTTCIPPGFTASVDAAGSLDLTPDA